MKITDGNKTIELVVADASTGCEWTEDFIPANEREYDDENNIYSVDDVDGWVEYALDWKYSLDEDTEYAEDPDSRDVYVDGVYMEDDERFSIYEEMISEYAED